MSDDRRCGAPTQSGRPCRRRPTKGHERCAQHGAGQPPTGSFTHGGFSKRFAKLTREGQDRLAAILADPELLDAKRPVAVATYMLQDMELVPDDDAIRALAKSYCPPGYEPGAVDIARARNELLKPIQKQVDLLGKRQSEAFRQAKLSELILTECVPIFELLGKAAFDLCEKYVPEAAQREKFMEAWRGHVAVAVARLTDVDTKS